MEEIGLMLAHKGYVKPSNSIESGQLKRHLKIMRTKYMK